MITLFNVVTNKYITNVLSMIKSERLTIISNENQNVFLFIYY